MKTPAAPALSRFPLLLFILLPSSFCLTACEVGPDYHRPQTKVSQGFNAPTPEPTTQATVLPATQRSITVETPASIANWWSSFNDPELDKLISRGVESNLDLKIATQRIREARATLGVTAANLAPTVNSTGSYERSHSQGAAGSGSASHFDHSTDFFQSGFDASWEIDVFGGLRRSVEAAQSDLAASEEDRRDTLVTLLSEIATDYIELRGFQQEIVIARENLADEQNNAEITRKKALLGTVAKLDIANAEAQVYSTASSLPVFETEVEQTIYAISVLLGEEPDALKKELDGTAAIPTTPPEVPIGLPSDLLRRRPDVRAAERRLASATARIGAAVAQLFPQFSLTGSLGLQNAKFTNWADASSRYWTIGPSVSWPIFDAGRLRSQIDVQNAQQMEALNTYQSTVLIALQDTKNALVAYAKEQVHRKALADTVEANERALDAATKLYKVGQTDFLNVVTAERSLLSSQDALVQSNRAIATDLVALYKALGGGWQSFEPTYAPDEAAPATASGAPASQPVATPVGMMGPPVPAQQ